MKKGFKIAGTVAGTIAGIAALAALLPYSCKKDEEKDELTVKALLWKYSSQPDPETEGQRKVCVDIGFHNPFAAETDDLLLENDEPLLDCTPIVPETPTVDEPQLETPADEPTETDFVEEGV